MWPKRGKRGQQYKQAKKNVSRRIAEIAYEVSFHYGKRGLSPDAQRQHQQHEGYHEDQVDDQQVDELTYLHHGFELRVQVLFCFRFPRCLGVRAGQARK
jgi:hypothetical protein